MNVREDNLLLNNFLFYLSPYNIPSHNSMSNRSTIMSGSSLIPNICIMLLYDYVVMW